MIPYSDLDKNSFDIKADLALAEQVQRSFLRKPIPAVDGIEIYADYTFAHQVGGDFYDFMKGPSNSLFFAIGDVSYKGMSAALMMAVLRKVIRTATRVDEEPTPSSILRYANVNMYEDLALNDMFATTFVGQYQPDSRCLTISNAGHAPVFYRGSDKCIRLLEANHVPLGVLETEAYTDVQIRMEKDDLLVVLTDGYMENQNQAGTVYGYDRLMHSINSSVAESPEKIAQIISETACQVDFGVPSYDDRALLVIKGAEG